MKEYIEKDAAIAAANILNIYRAITPEDAVAVVVRRINNTPPAEVKPVVRGEWVHRKVRHSLPMDCPPYYGEDYDRESHSCLEDEWHCSNCDYETDDIDKEWWNFCPNCGADMREAKDDGES